MEEHEGVRAAREITERADRRRSERSEALPPDLEREMCRVAVMEETMAFAVRCLDILLRSDVGCGDSLDRVTIRSVRNALDQELNPRLAQFLGNDNALSECAP